MCSRVLYKCTVVVSWFVPLDKDEMPCEDRGEQEQVPCVGLLEIVTGTNQLTRCACCRGSGHHVRPIKSVPIRLFPLFHSVIDRLRNYFLFLWRFLRSLFLRLCVAILWPLRFFPLGISVKI